jgi:hypothetical protein
MRVAESKDKNTWIQKDTDCYRLYMITVIKGRQRLYNMSFKTLKSAKKKFKELLDENN